MDERHAIHENTLGEDLVWHICLIEFRRRYDAKSDLMDVEIVILASKVHELPALGDGCVARPKRQADRRPHRVEGFHIHEGAGHRDIMLVEFFIAQTECVRVIRGCVEKDPALVIF